MMPDLGKYAFTVLSAWGVTLVLMGGLLVLTLWQGARMRRQLEAAEARARAAKDAPGQTETKQ